MDISTLTAAHPLPDGQLTLLGAVHTGCSRCPTRAASS
jgi:hypothetical protein